MAEQEKKIQLHTFASGLNVDIADELIEPSSLRYAINIRILSTAAGQKGIVTNCKGNTEIEYDLPDGENYTLGAKADPENNRFFWFNWNENLFHGLYMYEGLLNKVTPILINLTDTAGVDILTFSRDTLILHIDIFQDSIYWTNQDIKASKINFKKALDKSATGYGDPILSEYINAYKLAPIFPPIVNYYTDTTRSANYLYQHLIKATQLHVFDDGEYSNWSEFSAVPLPQNESFTGNPAISNINNALRITVETGSKIVKQIKIAVKIGSLDFVEIATLDKAKLGITDNTTYDYFFYNDNTSYFGLSQVKVQRAFSFLWKRPETQALAENSMIYNGALEGFPIVEVDLAAEIVYQDLFIPDGTANELNDPEFVQVAYVEHFTRKGTGRRTNSRITLRVGHDVKFGNFFLLSGTNGETDHLQFMYNTNYSDSALSVANIFKQQLVATGNIRSSADGLADADIWNNTINMDGDVTFSFIWYGRFNEAGTTFKAGVNRASNQILKDNGQSVATIKSGGSIKYAPLYWDEDTRRSATYPDDSWFLRTDFVTQTNGFKKIIHRLFVKHIPPIWAKYWELTRTVDLTYGTDWIQFLVQKVINTTTTSNQHYQDLVIGSIGTYQRMYPNSVISYQFEKNDRVRLMREEPGGTWIPFFETVVQDYKEISEQVKNEDVTVNNTASVTVGATSTDNIGSYISIEGVERQIVAVTSATVYQLDRIISFTEDPITYPSYKIIDYRNIIRISKPINYTVLDNTLIEVYKPTQNLDTAEKNYFLFNQKFAILNWGTAERAHSGNVQNQDPNNPTAIPAIVEISKGTSYVRQRQLPTNNAVPGTQVIIDLVESNGFSDFYESTLNDNGKVAPEDNGQGEKRFGTRFWFSGNAIEETGINGLNDFDNTNRRDYPGPYGKASRIVFWKKLLYVYFQLRDGYIPINASIIQDENGVELLKASPQLLNSIQYFAYEGGIGNNPEAYAADQTWQWHLYPNAGVIGRLGGDGVLPISQYFNLDSKTQEYINNAVAYGMKVYFGIDRENGELIIAFGQFNRFIYNGGFNPNWVLFAPELSPATEYEITTNALHGVVTIITQDGLPLFSYNPTTDYVGEDYFYYRWRVQGGDWTAPKKQCLLVVPPPADIITNVAYYNAELIVPFTQNNCGQGYHGEEVDYVVPELKYSSPYSQDDADQQAEDDAEANGQQYANDNGTCEINTPNDFTLIDVTGAPLNTPVISNAVTVTGSYPSYIIFSEEADYQINGGAFTNVPGIALLGDSVRLRRNSSTLNSTLVSGFLTIGDVTDQWDITTVASAGSNSLEINLATSEITVCDATPATVYVDAEYSDIAPGVVVFTDSGLTTAVTGFTFITNLAGDIFALDPTTGEVGAATTHTCPYPPGGSYFLFLSDVPGMGTSHTIYAKLSESGGSPPATIAENLSFDAEWDSTITFNTVTPGILFAGDSQVAIYTYDSDIETITNLHTSNPMPTSSGGHTIVTG